MSEGATTAHSRRQMPRASHEGSGRAMVIANAATLRMVGILLLIFVLVACENEDVDGDTGGGKNGGGNSDGNAAFDKEIRRVLEEDYQLDQDVTETSGALFQSDTSENISPAAANYLQAVIQHADVVWTEWFLSNGLAEPFVGYQIIWPAQDYMSGCNGGMQISSHHPNAYYCPVDELTDGAGTRHKGMVILPLETMAKMWNGDIFDRRSQRRVGDFAAAVITAHEFGHHIEDELANQLGVPPVAGKNKELIADCFAGVWAYSTWLDGYLEDGDLEEAIGALQAVGDQGLNVSHGTASERENAFLIGFTGSQVYPQGGVPNNCIEAFWGR